MLQQKFVHWFCEETEEVLRMFPNIDRKTLGLWTSVAVWNFTKRSGCFNCMDGHVPKPSYMTVCHLLLNLSNSKSVTMATTLGSVTHWVSTSMTPLSRKFPVEGSPSLSKSLSSIISWMGAGGTWNTFISLCSASLALQVSSKWVLFDKFVSTSRFPSFSSSLSPSSCFCLFVEQVCFIGRSLWASFLFAGMWLSDFLTSVWSDDSPAGDLELVVLWSWSRFTMFRAVSR